MDVSISPDLEQFVRQQVDAGNFSTTEEVIAEALHLLRRTTQLDQMKLEELRALVAVGLEQANHGKVAPLDGAAIRAEGRSRLAQDNSEGRIRAPRATNDAST